MASVSIEVYEIRNRVSIRIGGPNWIGEMRIFGEA
jgi:hypothetical protein